MVWLATKTVTAINEAIAADGGNTYRGWLGRILPHIGDAYRSDEDPYRSHLGASVIGAKCERSVAYGYRWAHKRPPRGRKTEDKVQAHGRMIRLWNRGHLEEGRFLAMMATIGVAIYQQDAEGKQYRISEFGGHLAGSTDGVLVGLPDLPMGVPAVSEYKTHGDKSFKKLVEEGVRESKPEHYRQMTQYMGKLGTLYGLYLAVNKNDDELYGEIIQYDGEVHAAMIERGRRIIFGDALPPRLRNASPGLLQCKELCDHTDVCFGTVKPDRNCRTCQNAFAMPDGTWQCAPMAKTLDKAAQIAGCAHYVMSPMFK
jgi:hypothetical protein